MIFKPSLPEQWNGFSFKLLYQGSKLAVSVSRDGAKFEILEGEPVTITVYDNDQTVTADGVTVPLQKLSA